MITITLTPAEIADIVSGLYPEWDSSYTFDYYTKDGYKLKISAIWEEFAHNVIGATFGYDVEWLSETEYYEPDTIEVECNGCKIDGNSLQELQTAFEKSGRIYP